MTLKLHAHVQRVRRDGNLAPGWRAGVTAHDDDGPTADLGAEGIAPSHPEAVQLARVLWADLDAQLMAEVHASRSSRRDAKAATLAAEPSPEEAYGLLEDLSTHLDPYTLEPS